jgi:hypothetical protein
MNSPKFLGFLLILPLLTACGGGGSTQSAIVPQSNGAASSTTPTLRQPMDTLGGIGSLVLITLEDAPPNLDGMTPSALYLGIDGVAVVSNGVVEPIASFSTPQVVNVMAQQNADPASIAIGDVYGGAYQQVQFTVDVASSRVVANNQNYPISFLMGPSQSSAGAGSTTTVASAGSGAITMTVTGAFSVGGKPAAAVQADFNALESLVVNPDGSISARPTLFAVPTALAGKISGSVQSSDACGGPRCADGSPVSNATVVAFDQYGNVANTASTDANGNYSMHTIAAGNYSLVVYNTYTTASGSVLSASGQQSSAATVSGSYVSVYPGSTTQAPSINE